MRGPQREECFHFVAEATALGLVRYRYEYSIFCFFYMGYMIHGVNEGRYVAIPAISARRLDGNGWYSCISAFVLVLPKGLRDDGLVSGLCTFPALHGSYFVRVRYNGDLCSMMVHDVAHDSYTEISGKFVYST